MKFITIGKILGAFGIQGLVKVYLGNDFKDFILTNYKKLEIYFDADTKLNIISIVKNTKFICLKLKDVNTRNDAEALCNKQLYCNELLLPKLSNNEFYVSSLIGINVVEKISNEKIGVVSSFYNHGAGDLVEITFINGKKEVYPFIESVFPDVLQDKLTFIYPVFI